MAEKPDIGVEINVSVKNAVGMLRHLHRQQLPFAVSVALNDTSNDVQSAVRQRLPQDGFTLRRRQFINNTIWRKPGLDFANKQSLSAGVRIHPERDVLAKFETDSIKAPSQGKSLAVPIAARPSKGAVVPKSLWPRSLGRSAFKLKLRKGGEGLFRRIGKGLQLLYVFKSVVPLRKRLHFADTARSIVTQMWPKRMDDALAKAIRTAKKK